MLSHILRWSSWASDWPDLYRIDAAMPRTANPCRAEALLRMTIHRCTDGTTEVVPDIEFPWPREVDSNFSQMKKAARKPPFPELEARTTATARSLPASPWAL